jgi:tetratricopeptide (TPR) repeat protein
MLQTIRAFGLEELAARGEEEGVREEHAAFFAGMVARARPELSGPEQGAWFDRFDVEHDDIRAALRWLLRRRETDVALRLVGVLWAFWWIRGYPGEGSDWLRQALALDGASDSATRALALAGAGTLAEVQGDYDRAAALHAESLALARANGSDLDAARALSGLAAIAQDQGDYDHAAARFAEALALYRQAGDETGIAQALIGLGTLAAYRGESEEAAQRLAEAVAQFTALGDDWGVAHARLNLGRLAFLDGDIERAGRESEEALTIFRRLGDAANIALLLANLGEIALHQGEIARAAELHDDALARFRALGDSRNIAATLVTRAEVEAARGDGEAAERLLRESLRLALALVDTVGIARALDAFAGVVVAGDPALARQSLDAADTLRAAIGAPLPAIYRSARERLRASASANLSSPAHVQEAPCSARPVEEIIASVLDFTRKLSSETSTQLNRAG